MAGGGGQANLKIMNDGSFSRFTTCNRGGGTAEAEERSIEFSGAYSTKMYCPGVGVMPVDTLMHWTLRSSYFRLVTGSAPAVPRPAGRQA